MIRSACVLHASGEVTVFKSGGGGHEDLATALMLYQRAVGISVGSAAG
jgi:ornithine cyclodeaminase/alanine dehydrogenase-like protein (mu-crystallin family)